MDANDTYRAYDETLDYRLREYEDYDDRRDASEEERYDPAERSETSVQIPQVMTRAVFLKVYSEELFGG